ncbi:hypothetical protein GCM10018980_14400 [Streptomyces capoamus]|uniref:Uncharacterized protein n=1 Tax=Streptomyces capoamus TaxID=68183 RepID=A0A919C330_9ACTN|nr:hypothetical protein GCM10010501_20100 [Streptomyces libani subsp. rufus]GHG40282.1 hypothetical protein GCM10018980_14400 [Streptomyces capoamus]
MRHPPRSALSAAAGAIAPVPSSALPTASPQAATPVSTTSPSPGAGHEPVDAQGTTRAPSLVRHGTPTACGTGQRHRLRALTS